MHSSNWFFGVTALAALGCGLDPIAAGGSTGGAASEDSGDTGTETEGEGDDAVRVSHAFGAIAMDAQSDDASLCASWTLDNEQALYVNNVVLANEGGFHHSNWFIVPDDVFDGADGYWPCAERNFDGLTAAQSGTVLFAQSTQSYVEEQRLASGAVVKVPPRSRIVADIHTLNTAPRVATSGLWLTLEVIHPGEVDAVVGPMSMQYRDLVIPPMSESRFVADCNLAAPYSSVTDEDLSLRVHYLLPHYHYLGNYFDVTVVGGDRDGESIYRLDGFNADANGKTFDPPLELPGATGLKMTCGYDNWRDETIEWGNGDGEMCVMLGLVEADAVLGASVSLGNHLEGVHGGIKHYEGNCFGYAVDKSEGQTMPSEDELAAPLYLPPVRPDDENIPPVPVCRDADADAVPEEPVSLTSLRQTVFEPSCGFSACHGQGGTAGALDLASADLHRALLEHIPLADAGMPLVSPGDAEDSWLYQLVSQCEPKTGSGERVSHMPLNAPILLEDALVAKLRAWIERGAPND